MNKEKLMNDSQDGVYLLDAQTGKLEQKIQNPENGEPQQHQAAPF